MYSETMFVLRLFSPLAELRQRYLSQVVTHHQKVASKYPDAGFDLFCPRDDIFQPGEKKLVGLNLHGAMFKINDTGKEVPCSYFMYPRSSISKTPLRLMNSVGIIDSGYRGELKEALHHCETFNNTTPYHIQEGQRLTQICAPNLEPFRVEFVDSLEQLGTTERGSGGFGSSGV